MSLDKSKVFGHGAVCYSTVMCSDIRHRTLCRAAVRYFDEGVVWYSIGAGNVI